MPLTSTQVRHKYWALTQHFLSVFSTCFRRLLFTVFTIWASDSSILKLLFRRFIHTIKESIAEFVWSCIFRKRSTWICSKFLKCLQYIRQSYFQSKTLHKICFAICTRNFICQEREVKSREAYNTIPVKILEVVLLVKQVDDLSQI